MKDEQYQLIVQFLEGKASKEEISELEKWRKASEVNELQFKEVQFLWQKSSVGKPQDEISIDVDAALTKVHKQIDQPTKTISLQQRLLRAASIAAVGALLLTAGLWFMQSPELIEVSTAFNEQKEIQLPDNSTVWLNQNSILSYPKNFEGSKRDVELVGNAVFEVTHNNEKPFVVSSEDIAVKVLGTKFNVNTNNKNGNSTVHVVNGKVQVSNVHDVGNVEIITKGMSIEFDDKAEQLSLTNEYNLNELFWMNKTLNFENIVLGDMFDELEKYYDTDIEIADSTLLTCTVNGMFKEKTVTEILESIQPIYKFELEQITSTNFKISKGKCE